MTYNSIHDVQPATLIRATPVLPDFVTKTVQEKIVIQGRHRLDRLLSGQRPQPGAIRLHTNDYLCLAHHPRIVDAEVDALQGSGHGDSISRVFTHRHDDPYRAFERQLARQTEAEDAVLCMSGYCANVGLIQALTGPSVPVYLDMFAHASLWEGAKSAGAVARPFRHNDPEHLERQVAANGPGLVAVDAIYSTTGTIAPLADLVTVAEQNGCALLVDETHSFGAQGSDGGGLVPALGLSSRVHFRTLGLSKAVASRGGAVLCSAPVADLFRYEALPMIFSTSVLAHEVAGFEAALAVIRDEPWRRDRLHANHAKLRAALDGLGYNVDASDAQIIGLEAGTEDSVLLLRQTLEAHGIHGAVFCAPATPKNRALVRLSVHCGLSAADIERVIAVCAAIRDTVGLADWASTRRRRGIRMPGRAAA